ncbi:hypothetical protein Tco_0671705 [Tanacetum coccineum]|uniref:Secreted protein n=1 Tax=Tanacetum coccineum TaxID=301880 RepID=A0ABQ4YZG2_9ASTR
MNCYGLLGSFWLAGSLGQVPAVSEVHRYLSLESCSLSLVPPITGLCLRFGLLSAVSELSDWSPYGLLLQLSDPRTAEP